MVTNHSSAILAECRFCGAKPDKESPAYCGEAGWNRGKPRPSTLFSNVLRRGFKLLIN
jgi:hypothetical protein